MIYAPVIIPTLDRFDHLKQCVDSLNNCHNADHTEVFISVDFPPTEKYQKGHDQICEYLDNTTFRFKKLHVFKQRENLGVAQPGSKKTSNAGFLFNIANEKFDRFIFTEDDNVFSADFLDFMDLCLERFKDDQTVYSICGYRFYYNLKFAENNFFRQQTDLNGWGIGYWRDKCKAMSDVNVSFLRKMVYNPIKVIRLWNISKVRVADLLGLSTKKGFKKADNFETLYMIEMGMSQIMPRVSKVKNIGWDGTGQHCLGFAEKTIEQHLNQEMDHNTTFDTLNGTGWEYYNDNGIIIRDEDYRPSPSTWRLLLKYIKRLLLFWI